MLDNLVVLPGQGRLSPRRNADNKAKLVQCEIWLSSKHRPIGVCYPCDQESVKGRDSDHERGE